MKIEAVALATIVAVACSSPLGVGPLGDWGSSEAHLRLELTGGSVQYQGGVGTVDSGWTVATDGTWSATGTHTIECGPVQMSHPASYSGHFSGDHLDYSVIILDLHDTLGPFHLVRDGPNVYQTCF